MRYPTAGHPPTAVLQVQGSTGVYMHALIFVFNRKCIEIGSADHKIHPFKMNDLMFLAHSQGCVQLAQLVKNLPAVQETRVRSLG